jgi:hypothetical protein
MNLRLCCMRVCEIGLRLNTRLCCMGVCKKRCGGTGVRRGVWRIGNICMPAVSVGSKVCVR